MSPVYLSRLPGRVRDWVHRRLRAEGGFILIESIIAITLITFIMGAVGAEYVTGLATTGHQRAETTAIQIADSTVENLRALHPSDLITGRDKISVGTEYTTLAGIPAVAPWLSSNTNQRAYDGTVSTGGSSATVPTTATTQKPDKISYQVYQYLECTAASSDGTCKTVSGAQNAIRAIVAVVWSQRGCASNTCSYVTSTVINADSDPTFDLNQALPPAPVIQDPGAQTVVIGDTVALQLTVQNGKGVAPFTWNLTGGSLPSGLQLSPTGLIASTPPNGVTGSAGTASSTIQVTDAFLRTSTVTINWTIKAAVAWVPQAGQPAGTPYKSQNGFVGTSTSLQTSATGGMGAPYTYADPGHTLPPGLSINASTGLISGTPTGPATTYPVSLTVTDSSGTRSATTTFTWTISYPPLSLSNPLNQTTSAGTPVNLALSASGGDGAYTWSASNLPTGLSISATTGKITGTPSQVNSWPVTVTVSDPSAGVGAQQITFTWTVYTAPTIGAQADQQGTKGAADSYQVTGASCPNGGCTYSATGLPSNLTINASSGLISGTLATNASTSAVTVTVTDSAGMTASTSFNWTVYAAPTLAGLGAHTDAETVVDNVPVDYTCPYVNCTIALAAGAVPGIGLSTTANKAGNNTAATTLVVSNTSGTVYLTGTVQSTAVTSGSSKAYTTSLTITDGGGYKPAASTGVWTAYSSSSAQDPDVSGLADQAYTNGSTVKPTFSYLCRTSSCTVKVTGAPSGVGLDTNTSGSTSSSLSVSTTTAGTLYLRGKLTSTGTYGITVTITNGNGVVDSVYAVWTVT